MNRYRYFIRQRYNIFFKKEIERYLLILLFSWIGEFYSLVQIYYLCSLENKE